MTIKPKNNHLDESQVKTNLDKLFSDPSVNAQAKNQYELYLMITSLIKVYELLGSARNLSNLAAIKAGFASSDETEMAGSIVGVGGLVLGATGSVQGIGKFQEAKGIAEATEIRNHNLKLLDEEFKNKDLNKDITVEVEAVDEPCTSGVNDDIVSEIEEDALCDAEEALHAKQQNKMQDQAKEQIKEANDLKRAKIDKQTEKKNKRINLINKEYEILADSHKAESGKFQSIGTPGQAAYYVAQGLSEHQKAKSQKDSLVQQVQQDNQNQQGNTADGVKKDIDKLSDFDPFRRNSASLSQR